MGVVILTSHVSLGISALFTSHRHGGPSPMLLLTGPSHLRPLRIGHVAKYILPVCDLMASLTDQLSAPSMRSHLCFGKRVQKTSNDLARMPQPNPTCSSTMFGGHAASVPASHDCLRLGVLTWFGFYLSDLHHRSQNTGCLLVWCI